MSRLLKGGEVAAAINQKSVDKIEELRKEGVEVTLAIVRVGERPDDLSYERSAMKRASALGIEVRNEVMAQDVSAETFYDKIEELNSDDSVHGILLLRPLPWHLNEEKARNMIAEEKDVDGCSDISLSSLLTGAKRGFVPCTAQSVIEILDYYGIEISGKKAVVVGRSLVIGKPVSLLLLNRNATVTTCHSRTQDIQAETANADIVIAAIGKAEFFGREYFREGQTVIDVGMNYSQEKGKFCGDVCFEEVEPLVESITPVPGGVGSVTTAVLMSHVVQAAERQAGKEK